MLSQPFPGPLPFWDPSWGPHGTLPGPPWAPLGPGSPHNCNPCGALTTALVCLTVSFAFSMFLVEFRRAHRWNHHNGIKVSVLHFTDLKSTNGWLERAVTCFKKIVK
jgi:hypothetical protein